MGDVVCIVKSPVQYQNNFLLHWPNAVSCLLADTFYPKQLQLCNLSESSFQVLFHLEHDPIRTQMMLGL